jgi:hypothetical protein
MESGGGGDILASLHHKYGKERKKVPSRSKLPALEENGTSDLVAPVNDAPNQKPIAEIADQDRSMEFQSAGFNFEKGLYDTLRDYVRSTPGITIETYIEALVMTAESDPGFKDTIVKLARSRKKQRDIAAIQARYERAMRSP